MKSLTQSLLSLVLLLNTSTLLAQDENRLKAEGYRLKEAENQDADYRQQTIALPLRSDTIPISNLPSSISYLGVAPKLMMNPSIEEGTKVIEEALGAFGKKTILLDSATERATTKTRLPVGSSSSSASRAMISRKAVEAVEATEPEGEFLEDGSIALEKANQKRGSGDDLMTMEGGYLFPSVGGGMYNGRWYTSHALERMAPETPEIMKILVSRAIKRAQSAGFTFDVDSFQSCAHQPDALSIWWKVYCPREKGMPISPFKQWWYTYGPQPRGVLPSEVEAEIAHPGTTGLMVITSEEGDVKTVIRKKVLLPSNSTETGLSVENSSSSATMEGEGNLESVEAIEAALTAEESEEDDVNAFLEKEEEGGKTETIEELEGKMQETDIKGDSKAANNQHSCSKRNAKDRAMEQMGQMTRNCQKARAALAQGMSERVVLWKKAAEQSLTSANKWKQVAQVCVSGDKETVKAMLSRAYLADFLSDAATSIATSSEKAEEAFAQGNQDLAMLWNKVATKYQESVEYKIQAVNSVSTENDTDHDRFDQAAISARKSAQQLEKASAIQEKATQATEANQKEFAGLWSKIAQQYQELAEYHSQVANSSLSGSFTDYSCFDKADKSVRQSAKQLEEASSALEKAMQVMEAGKGELAVLWIKTVKQYQEFAEYYRQEASDFLSGNVDQNKRRCFIEAYNVSKVSTKQLEEASNALGKAVQASEANQRELAAMWHKTAQKFKESAEYQCQAVNAAISGNNNDYDNQEARYAEKSAKQLEGATSALEKATQAMEVNQAELAAQWSKIAKSHYKAANSAISQNATNYKRFDAEATLARSSVKKLEKQAQQAGKTEKLERKGNSKEEMCEKITILLANPTVQTSGEIGLPIESSIPKEVTKKKRWGGTAKSVRDRANSQAQQATLHWQKESEALAQGMSEGAILWRKAAEHSLASAEEWRQVLQACLSEDWKTAKATVFHLEKTAYITHFLSHAAKSTAMSEEALAKGNQELAALWSTMALQYQELVEYYRKVASDLSNVNDGDYDRFVKADQSIETSAKHLEEAITALEKAAQAKEEKQEERAALWLQIAGKHQEAAECHRHAAHAAISQNSNDYDRFDQEAVCARESVQRLEKASKAADAAISQNLPDYQRLQGMAISEKKSANKLEKQKEKLKQKGKKNEAKKNDREAFLRDRVTAPTSVAICLPVGSNSSSSSSATISEQGVVEAGSTTLTAEESEEEDVGSFLEEDNKDEQSEGLEELEGQVKAFSVKENSNTAHVQHNWSKRNARERVAAQTEQAARSRQKESEALAQGMLERAVLWRKAAEQSEASAEEWKKVLQACVSENEETVKAMASRAYSDFCLSHAATSIAKSEEALAKGNHEQAALWSNIATQYEESAEYRRQAANALSSGNNAGYDCLDTAGKYAETGALQLENVFHALEKAAEAAKAGEVGLAALWSKTAEQYKEFAEYHRQDASDYSHGNVDKRKQRSFWEAHNAIKGSIKQLEEASSALEKAVQARATNQGELATIWLKVAEKFKESVEYKYQAANVRSNAADRKRFNKIGKSAMISAYCLKNSITAQEQATQVGTGAVAPAAVSVRESAKTLNKQTGRNSPQRSRKKK